VNMKMRWTRTTGRSLALGAAALAAGLSARGVAAQIPTTITVDNARDVPLVVYLEGSYYDQRLGTVAPHAKSALPLPKFLREGDAIRVIVHPEGQRDLASPEGIHVESAHPLTLYVPRNDLGWVPPAPKPTIPNPGTDDATLTVDNPRDHAVVVLIEHGEFDTRVGTVPAHAKETFPLPEALTGRKPQVEIFVHAEGGVDMRSDHFDLSRESTSVGPRHDSECGTLRKSAPSPFRASAAGLPISTRRRACRASCGCPHVRSYRRAHAGTARCPGRRRRPAPRTTRGQRPAPPRPSWIGFSSHPPTSLVLKETLASPP